MKFKEDDIDKKVLPMKKSNIGKPAVSDGDIDFFTKEYGTEVKKAGKRKNNKEVVNPIFEEYCKCTDDPFWKEKFTNASYNKFPKNFFFSEGKLSFKKGPKILQQELTSSVFQNAENCMEFFRFHGRLFSTMDQNNSTRTHMSAGADKEFMTWEKYNRKTQNVLLSYYTWEEKDKKVLTKEEHKCFRKLIEIGILNRNIDKSSIIMVGNRITEIKGLNWDEERRSFFLDEKPKSSSSRTSKKKDTSDNVEDKNCEPKFHSKWKKYGKHLLEISNKGKPADCKKEENQDSDSFYSEFDNYSSY